MSTHAHFTPADRPLADTFAAVLEDPAASPLVADLHNIDIGRSPEDRYELACLLAVVARLANATPAAGTDPLPTT